MYLVHINTLLMFFMYDKYIYINSIYEDLWDVLMIKPQSMLKKNWS